jgi:hypothetical protein
MGRINWLFLGSDNGGQTAAVLFSFTATAARGEPQQRARAWRRPSL